MEAQSKEKPDIPSEALPEEDKPISIDSCSKKEESLEEVEKKQEDNPIAAHPLNDKKQQAPSKIKTKVPKVKEPKVMQAIDHSALVKSFDQMPQLALKCAQYFHSMSQYCLSVYNNAKEEGARKNEQKARLKAKREEMKAKKIIQDEGQAMGQDGNNLIEPPKKPLTAYIIYFQEKKHQFVAKYPSLSLSEITRLIAKEWKELHDSKKKDYLEKAAEDRKKYETQMAQFKAKYGKKIQWDEEANREEFKQQFMEENMM